MKLFLDKLGKETALFFGGILLAAMLVVELIRIDYGMNIYGNLLKKKEKHYFHSFSLIFLIGMLVFSIFNEKLAFAAMSIVIIGDWSAAMVGRFFGKHRFKFNKTKTVEGFISYFVAGTAAGLIFLPLKIVFPMSLVAACVELLCNKTDDNVIIPVIIAYIGYFISII